VDLDNIENCAFQWAQDTNSFTCSYVYNNLDTSVDLCTGDYAQGAFPIIETQIAKGILFEILFLIVAGLRLAIFLNLAVTGQPGWGGSLGFKVQAP
jgi:hypothetical protein